MALTANQRSLLCVVVAIIGFVMALQVMGIGLFNARIDMQYSNDNYIYMQRLMAQNLYDRFMADLSRGLPSCTLNPCVFLDISIDSSPSQRLVLQLYRRKAPNAVANFRALISGERGVSPNGTPLHYRGTSISRVVRDILIQGGDIYGGKDINEDLDAIDVSSLESETDNDVFDKAGLLSLVGSGTSRNGFEFFITIDIASELNGMHVILGEVIRGMDIVYKINNVTLKDTEPQVPIIITQCGEL